MGRRGPCRWASGERGKWAWCWGGEICQHQAWRGLGMDLAGGQQECQNVRRVSATSRVDSDTLPLKCVRSREGPGRLASIVLVGRGMA